MEYRLAVWVKVRDGLPANPFVSDGNFRSDVGDAHGHSSGEALAIPGYELIAQWALKSIVIGRENPSVIIDDCGVEIVIPTMVECCAGAGRASSSAVVGEYVREIILKVIGTRHRSASEHRGVARVVVEHGSADARTVPQSMLHRHLSVQIVFKDRPAVAKQQRWKRIKRIHSRL